MRPASAIGATPSPFRCARSPPFFSRRITSTGNPGFSMTTSQGDIMKERKPYERKVRGRFLGWYIKTPSAKNPGKITETWLGRSKKEAYANWARLKAGEAIIRPEAVKLTEPQGPPLTIRDAADAFLAEIEAATNKPDRAHGKKAKGTHAWYKRYLDSFCDFRLGREGLGSLPFVMLRKDHVKRWIDSHPAWTDNTAHAAARCAMALCNWLVDSDAERFEWITKSPLKGFKKAPPTARDCYITADEWKRILAVVDDELHDALTFMRLTGCRPDEMRRAEKRHVDLAIPAIVFPPNEWKCGKKLKRDRVIRLAGEALVIVQKRCLKYPTGAIFRGYGGVPMKKDALARRMKRLSVKLGIPHLIPYAIRHTFASDAAFKVDCLVLAELMGTSVKMLENVYAKARKRMDLMGQAAAKAIEDIA
jgi:integrase